MATITKTIGTGKDYATITAWRDDLDDTGIYSSGDNAVGLISVNQVFNEQVALNNGVTGLNSVKLTVDTPYRHTGVKGTGARIEYTGSGSYILSFNRNYPGGVHVEWLEIHRTTAWDAQNYQLFYLGSSCDSSDYEKQTLSNMIFTASGNDGGQRGCVGLNANSRALKVSNCLIYDILNNSTNSSFHVYAIGNDETVYVENCTIYNVSSKNSTTVTGIGRNTDSTTLVKNCLVFNVTNTGSGTAECISSGITTTTSMTSDTTGTSGLTSKSASNVFVSLSPVNLHLKNGSIAWDVGTNLGTPSIDIDGFARPTSSYSWDLGADEYTFPLNVTAPVLSTSGTVTSGTWDSQSNGTITRTTYLRLASDDSLVATLFTANPDFSSYVTPGTTYYVVERASNDGGYDDAEDTQSANTTIAASGETIELTSASEAETSYPLTIAQPKTILLGIATEVESGYTLTIGIDQTIPLNTGFETELSYPISIVNPKSYQLNLTSEVESVSSLIINIDQTIDLGIANENETANTLTILNPKTHGLGIAKETETTYSLSINNPRTYSLGNTTETETGYSLSITNDQAISLQYIEEVETAYSLTITNPRAYQLNTPQEIESATTISIINPRTYSLQNGEELETVFAMSINTGGQVPFPFYYYEN